MSRIAAARKRVQDQKAEAAEDQTTEETETEETETEEQPDKAAKLEVVEDAPDPAIQKFEDPISGEIAYRVGKQWYDTEIEAKASLVGGEARKNIEVYVLEIFGEEKEGEDRATKRERTLARTHATEYEKWRLVKEAEALAAE